MGDAAGDAQDLARLRMVVIENGLDDPDQNFYENYTCGAARNYGGYCNHEVDALIDRQSMETDLAKRRQLVWDIEKKLIEDDVRLVLFHPRAAVCTQSWVKAMTQMVKKRSCSSITRRNLSATRSPRGTRLRPDQPQNV